MDAELSEKYSGNIWPTRAIYPARFLPYVAVLAGAKFFRSFGIFISYDVLKLIHLVQFLFLINAGAAIFLMLIQKPLSGRKISKRQWFRICRHAVFAIIIQLLWFYGLTLCGPMRTLLMFEHSDIIVIATVNSLFTTASSPSKFRGAVLFLLSFLCIMLFDHDLDKLQHVSPLDSASHTRHESFLSHIFNHLTNLTGLSDHKAGVVLLLITLFLKVGYNMASKNLSLDIGGSKRLHALSTSVSVVILMPWSIYISYARESIVESWGSLMFPVLLVTVWVFVIDYYIEAACVSRLDVTRTGQFGMMAVLVSALVINTIWNHPFVSQMTNIRQVKNLMTEEHEISVGVVFSVVLFAFATHILTKPVRGTKGTLIGYSAAGPPLYSFAGEALQRKSHSLFVIAKNGLRQILEESDSRRIFFFLCINMCFTFVELAYGVWTNSLGLISDGFHMFFDCSALVMGLYAALMSHWKATRIFSFGYDRVEILSGFINGLFLMVIAFFVFSAAISRLIDPPEINTNRLLFVSVAGFCVNLVGIFAFRHNHSHGISTSAGHGHSHGGSGGGHGHSHGASGGHGHSHGSSGSCQTGSKPSQMTHNTNMEGVFLHVLADTLGSVGVILSTLLIENFGWKIADPICSIFISVLIFVSVLPLVKETSLILLLRTPEEIQQPLAKVLHKLLSLEGIASYSDDHFWRHSSNVICGTIHIQINAECSEQKVVSQVTALFKEVGVTNLCVQIEKRSYFQHLSGLGVTPERMHSMLENVKAFGPDDQTEDFIRML